MAAKREKWREEQQNIPPEKAVFIDETWAKTCMTRTCGRSPIGTRLIEKVPRGRWQTTTFLGAMRADGFIAPLTVDGAINGELFLAWIEQHLVPALRPGDIVVMDNLSSHKVLVQHLRGKRFRFSGRKRHAVTLRHRSANRRRGTISAAER